MQIQYWTSTGMLGLSDSGREYTYFGVNRDTYDHVARLCRRGQRGEVYRVLKGFSRRELCDI
jgi:hypothetical protein